MALKRQDMTGLTFGRLTVVAFAGMSSGRNARWHCVCRCGKKRVVFGAALRSGTTISCGCAHREAVTTHGQCRSPEYRAWWAMRTRCFNEKSENFEDYGGRGITVCKRWLKFENFLADMGPRPSAKHTLERMNNDGDYTPRNCRWATNQEQQSNTRRTVWITVKGKRMSVAQAARACGLSYNVLRKRVQMFHWPIEKALRTPCRVYRARVNGVLLEVQSQ